MSAALDVAERALRAARVDEAEAVVLAERSGFARFAGSEVHQPTLIEDEIVHLRVVRDGRVGAAATNTVSDEGFATLARRAEAAADASPADPEFPGLPEPAPLPDVDANDVATAELGADDQAHLAAAAIRAANGFDVYGFFTSGASTLAVANSRGQAVEQRMTDAVALTLAAADGASGYACRAAWRAADVDPEAVSREAVEKAARTRGAGEVEPATYRACSTSRTRPSRGSRCSKSEASPAGGSASASSTRS
jgi:predicted Zn-dependent protease